MIGNTAVFKATSYKKFIYESHSDVLGRGVSGPGLKIDGPGPEYPNTLALGRLY